MNPDSNAIVRPRAFNADGDVRPLKDLIEEAFLNGVSLIRLTGEGKSTAIRFLAEQLSHYPEIHFVDHAFDEIRKPPRLTVYSSPMFLRHSQELKLARWGLEDCIEYVMSKAPDHCRCMIGRLQNSGDLWMGSGSPNVISAALDQMIADAKLPNLQAAIESHFLVFPFKTAKQKERLLSICLKHLFDDARVAVEISKVLQKYDHRRMIGFLSSMTVRYALVIRKLIDNLSARRKVDCLSQASTPMFFRFCADEIRSLGANAAIEQLDRIANGANNKSAPAAASILRCTDTQWRPRRRRALKLTGAFLSDVDWSESEFRGSDFRCANLNGANLNKVKLKTSDLRQVDFSSTDCENSRWHTIVANQADFSDTSMTNVLVKKSTFSKANFSRAVISKAEFTNVNFEGADFTESVIEHAKLTRAKMQKATLRNASMRHCRFDRCDLKGVDLVSANLQSVRFVDCQMKHAVLSNQQFERVEFTICDLSHSVWSHSLLSSCSLNGSDLRGGFLGDIHWLNCDLRNVNFFECQFFFGSTRSGLVNSPYPGHGSRTGFYTDDYEDQYFKSVEEICKASLRGCNSCGANVLSTDFYLVDLRDAIYDSRQQKHFQRCGAILSD